MPRTDDGEAHCVLPPVGDPLAGSVMGDAEDAEVGGDVQGAVTRVDSEAVHVAQRVLPGRVRCPGRWGAVAGAAPREKDQRRPRDDGGDGCAGGLRLRAAEHDHSVGSGVVSVGPVTEDAAIVRQEPSSVFILPISAVWVSTTAPARSTAGLYCPLS